MARGNRIRGAGKRIKTGPNKGKFASKGGKSSKKK